LNGEAVKKELMYFFVSLVPFVVNRKMNTPQTVHISLRDTREYDIHIGAGAARDAAAFIKSRWPSARAFVVTDRNVAKLHLDGFTKILKSAKVESRAEVLPAGERVKNLVQFGKLLNSISAADDERGTVVIALGGGVIGDLAGFASASYRRGVPLIQMPTTLLACVDSSVGGKTAVDLPAGKNLAGAFYQPAAVFMELEHLRTLPKRELRAGYAEVVKTALIFSGKFFKYLETHRAAVLAAEPSDMAEVVQRCCRHKADVVVKDERDSKGFRALLNLGHTFGHAAEAALGYSKLRHGEAVAAGIVCAADMSVNLGMLSADNAKTIENHIKGAGLPVYFTGCTANDVFARMKLDKKFAAGENRFVLLEGIGRAALVRNVPRADIMKVLKKRVR